MKKERREKKTEKKREKEREKIKREKQIFFPHSFTWIYMIFLMSWYMLIELSVYAFLLIYTYLYK